MTGDVPTGPNQGKFVAGWHEHFDKDIREHARKIAYHLPEFRRLIIQAKAEGLHKLLWFKSWPAYVADVVGKEMTKLPVDDRRQIIAVLSGEGMSQRAIAVAVGVSQKTVDRDLDQVSHDDSPASVTGLDNKTHPAKKTPAKKAAPKPKLTVVKDDIAPKAETTIVVASAIPLDAAKAEPEQPTPVEQEPVEQDSIDTDAMALWFEDVAGILGRFADFLESLEDEERKELVPAYLESYFRAGEQFQRVFAALGLDEDAAIERVGKTIVRWLTKLGPSTQGAIYKKLQGPNEKKHTLGDRRFFKTALERLVQAGSVVVADDGEIELEAGEPQ